MEEMKLVRGQSGSLVKMSKETLNLEIKEKYQDIKIQLMILQGINLKNLYMTHLWLETNLIIILMRDKVY